MTPNQHTPGLDLSAALSENLVLHSNMQQEIVVTTVDKMKICLMQHSDTLSAKDGWLSPFGLLVALVTTIVAADFRDALTLKAPTWQAIYVIASVGAGIWTIRAVYAAVVASREGGIDALIDRIANRASPLYRLFAESLHQRTSERDGPSQPLGDA